MQELQVETTTTTMHQGYALGDFVGQGRSVLRYMFKGASVRCGKAFDNDDSGAAEHEKHVSEAVHDNLECPTLIKVLESFVANKRTFIIMPLLSQSVAELLSACAPRIPSDATCARITAAVLAAMAGLAMVGWCHGDIKPQNIMLGTGEARPVLVDLGSCAKVYGRLTEFTLMFGLGLPKVAGLRWDLACLASTLYLLSCPPKPTLPGTLKELRQQLSGQDALSLGHRTALRICEVHEKVGDRRAAAEGARLGGADGGHPDVPGDRHRRVRGVVAHPAGQRWGLGSVMSGLEVSG